MNFTKEEKKFLELLFAIGENIVNSQGSYIDLNGESFSSNDLFDLKQKLGLED